MLQRTLPPKRAGRRRSAGHRTIRLNDHLRGLPRHGIEVQPLAEILAFYRQCALHGIPSPKTELERAVLTDIHHEGNALAGGRLTTVIQHGGIALAARIPLDAATDTGRVRREKLPLQLGCHHERIPFLGHLRGLPLFVHAVDIKRPSHIPLDKIKETGFPGHRLKQHLEFAFTAWRSHIMFPQHNALAPQGFILPIVISQKPGILGHLNPPTRLVPLVETDNRSGVGKLYLRNTDSGSGTAHPSRTRERPHPPRNRLRGSAAQHGQKQPCP